MDQYSTFWNAEKLRLVNSAKEHLRGCTPIGYEAILDNKPKISNGFMYGAQAFNEAISQETALTPSGASFEELLDRAEQQNRFASIISECVPPLAIASRFLAELVNRGCGGWD